MKITLDKTIAEFRPENAEETAYLEALWVKMANCVGDNKKLAPIGVYQPQEKNIARFVIEGLSDEEAAAPLEVRAPYDTDVYCTICNKTVSLKKGDIIPICCGKLMEILD